MNEIPRRIFDTDADSPLSSIGERLLAAVAVKIELPPSQHRLAIERKLAVEKYIERDGSPLKDSVRLFYQQGSMAIGATIRAKRRDEGYDIDIVVEMIVPSGITPYEALNLLYITIRGEPGSRYYDCTKRQTRCVTIEYADDMHIDLTPAILLDELDPRLSVIFHSKPEEVREKDQRVLMNSFAFAEEFNIRCPVDQAFAKAYGRMVQTADIDVSVAKADAESQPVPEHSTVVGGKSAVTVALQLLKRNRNLRYRHRIGRMPPSVMLSCLALEVAAPGRSIGDNICIIAAHVVERLEHAKENGELINVVNPRCANDCFTDRWPVSHKEQDEYIRDLQLALSQLVEFFEESRSIKDRVKLLEEMFGESVAREVIEDFGAELGHLPFRTARNITGIGGALPIFSSSSVRAKPNTFYGTKWPTK